MAISFVGAGAVTWQGTGTGSAGLDLALPSGLEDDDFLIAFLSRDDDLDDYQAKTGWDMQSLPDGTVDLKNVTAGPDGAVYTRFRDGTEADPEQFVHGNAQNEQWGGVILAYRGVDTTTPFDTVITTAHATIPDNVANPTSPAITTTNNNAWVVLFHGFNNDDISAAGAPSGYTLRASQTTTANSGAGLAIADQVIVSAGTETPGAWTHTASPTNQQENCCFTFALRAAAGAGEPAYVEVLPQRIVRHSGRYV